MRVLLPFLVAASLLAQPGGSSRLAEGPLRAHLAFLADDLLEGRGTGQRGAELTVRYLETQLQALGLRPARGDSFRQPVSLLGLQTRVAQSTLSFLGGGACATPTFGRDIVYGPGIPQAEQTFDAPVVFLGFGIDAPEFHWNDYKDLDLRGKVLLMLVNEPAPRRLNLNASMAPTSAPTAAGPPSSSWRPATARPECCSSTPPPPPATAGPSCATAGTPSAFSCPRAPPAPPSKAGSPRPWPAAWCSRAAKTWTRLSLQPSTATSGPYPST